MRLTLLIFLLSITKNLTAQSWRVTEETLMPESITNSAITEGGVGDTTFIFAFLLKNWTKKWMDFR